MEFTLWVKKQVQSRNNHKPKHGGKDTLSLLFLFGILILVLLAYMKRNKPSTLS
uniref:putative holin-like toxin n=1 Tax=Paenibacillus sp. FSL R5-0749 TaxID=2921657 RepID=UPI00406CF7E4